MRISADWLLLPRQQASVRKIFWIVSSLSFPLAGPLVRMQRDGTRNFESSIYSPKLLQIKFWQLSSKEGNSSRDGNERQTRIQKCLLFSVDDGPWSPLLLGEQIKGDAKPSILPNDGSHSKASEWVLKIYFYIWPLHNRDKNPFCKIHFPSFRRTPKEISRMLTEGFPSFPLGSHITFTQFIGSNCRRNDSNKSNLS